MTTNRLRELQILESKIDNIKQNMKDIKSILSDFDAFGSHITFNRNKDNVSFSFGSKKFNYKDSLKEILHDMLVSLENDLVVLTKEFTTA